MYVCVCDFLIRCAVRLGSRASIRTSLLVNSLGLETGGVKGASPPSGQVSDSNGNKRRLLMADSSSSSRFSSEQETDSRSTGSSSGSGTPDPRSAPAGPCQRCEQQQTAALEADLKSELEAIKDEMKKANLTINALQEREKQMKARYVTS